MTEKKVCSQRTVKIIWSVVFAGIIFWGSSLGFSESSSSLEFSERTEQQVWGKSRAYIQSQMDESHTLAAELESFEGLPEDASLVSGDKLAAGPQSFPLVDSDGTVIAEVMPGTPLTVVSTSKPEDAQVKVKIRGWSIKVYPVALATDVGQRIFLARLSEAGISKRQTLQEAKDDYGEVWQEAVIIGFAEKTALVRDVSEIWELADRFYVKKCGVCHSPQSSTEYPAYQWPGIMKTMNQYTHIDREGLNLLLAYLQLNARDMVDADILQQTQTAKKISTENKVPVFQGYEDASDFSVVAREEELPLPLFPCSECHQPDPPELDNLPELMSYHPKPTEMFHGDGMMWCLDCHQSKESDQLHTLRGQKINVDKSFLVCGQCHSDRLEDWYFGGHGKRLDNWRGKRTVYNCTACHDPHDPGIKPKKPQPPPPVRIGLKRHKTMDTQE